MSADREPMVAGRFTAQLIDGHLANLDVDGIRILDRAYPTVRDRAWRPIIGNLTESSAHVAQDAFEFRTRHVHLMDGIQFDWVCEGMGGANELILDFTVTVSGDVVANRIGVCLLHPLEMEGRQGVAVTASGETPFYFPRQIMPHPLITECTALEINIVDQLWCSMRFAGATFETEDHRNWTDPGWKTYSPPLSGSPMSVTAGTSLHQRITFGIRSAAPALPVEKQARRRRGSSRNVVVRVDENVVGQMPSIGVVTDGSGDMGVVQHFRDVGLSHLYIEWSPRDGRGPLDCAAGQALSLAVPLDVAIVEDEADADWTTIASVLAGLPRLGRISVFGRSGSTTGQHAPRLLKHALRECLVTSRIGGGTLSHFVEINRARLDTAELDFLTFGVTPQTHHRDSQLVMETTRTHAAVLENAVRIATGKPVVIGPVSFTRRDEPNPDPRLLTEFAAAWIAGSAAGFLGAEAVTYFQLSGKDGLIAPSGEPNLAALAVLKQLNQMAGKITYHSCTDDPAVTSLAVGTAVMITNLSPRPRRVTVQRPRATAPAVELAPYGFLVWP